MPRWLLGCGGWCEAGLRAACLVLALLLSAGCGDDAAPRRLVQPSGTGTIEGRLRSPDLAERRMVSLRGVSGTDFDLMSSTDSSGAFALAAPLGRYVLYLSGLGWYSSAGLTSSSHDADTLDVTLMASHLSIEVPLGSAEVHILVPRSMDGTLLLCDILSGGDYQSSGFKSANCRDGEAVFRFPSVGPGDYVVEVSPDWSDRVLIPVGSTRETAARFAVGTADRTVIRVDISAPAIVVGTLEGSLDRLAIFSGFSIFRRVTAFRADSSVLAEPGWSDAHRWELRIFDPQPFRLCVTIGGTSRWIGGRTFEEAPFFTPVLGETLLVPPEVESGFLVRLEDAAGDIHFRPRIEVYDSLASVVSTLVDECGACERGNRFGIANLVPGTYYVRFVPASFGQGTGWSTCWYDGAHNLARATPVRIHERGELVELDVRLPAAAVIRGLTHTEMPNRYNSYRGPEILSAADTLHALGEADISVITDPWQFSGMEPGRYLLRVPVWWAGDQRYWWYPGTWNASEARAVELDDFGREVTVEWDLPL